MCGIVGAVSSKNIVEVLIEGLRRLEYRGYDSCGFAVINSADAKHPIERARTTARVAELAEQGKQFIGTLGIAHTRWATHGKPDTQNAHPHISNGLIAVVHNGIIENYEALRSELQSAGYVFTSETDTEVIAHLIHQAYVAQGQKDLGFAVRSVLSRLHGAYAVGVIAQDQPELLIGARVGSPLVIALGEGENFLASDALALAGRAHSMVYLEEGDGQVQFLWHPTHPLRGTKCHDASVNIIHKLFCLLESPASQCYRCLALQYEKARPMQTSNLAKSPRES